VNELETAIPPDCRGKAADCGSKSLKAKRRSYSKKITHYKKRVTEAEYWQKYYNDPDTIYEWNNGILEDKATSDKITNSMYMWLYELVGHYFQINPIGEKIFLETGFRMPLPHKVTIRRPDLGIILNSNPVLYEANDHSYKGICNLCVEALSDLSKKYLRRDTKTKFEEYEAAGVEEYYIIYSNGEPMEFYHLNEHGVYVPIKRVNGDVIKSKVLPGFQFRLEDLYMQPSPQDMAFDPIYQKFVLPYYQEAKKARQAAENALEEIKARQTAETQLIEAKKARQAAEEKIKLLEAKL